MYTTISSCLCFPFLYRNAQTCNIEHCSFRYCVFMLPKMEGRKIAHIAERDVCETLHLSVGHIVLSQQDKAQALFVWKLMYLFVCFPEIVIFADLLGSFVSRAVMVLLIQLVIRCNSSTAQAFVFYFLLSASLEFKL